MTHWLKVRFGPVLNSFKIKGLAVKPFDQKTKILLQGILKTLKGIICRNNLAAAVPTQWVAAACCINYGLEPKTLACRELCKKS